MKRILIFGANGMAGHLLSNYLKTKSAYEIIDVCHSRKLAKDSVILDIRNIAEVSQLLTDTKPDIVINCIGILNNRAEQNPPEAIYINSYFPRYLEDYYQGRAVKVIQLSTDCVFSGKDGHYIEKSLKDGQDIYSLTKSLGEIINSKDLTIRTSIIGPELKENGVGLFHWFMMQSGEINGFEGVNWTGITTLELARSIDRMIRAGVTGLFQLVPDKAVTKYQLLNIIKQVFNKKIVINKVNIPVIDRTLQNTRTDFQVNIPGYETMIIQLLTYMLENKDLYQLYFSSS